jgi:hypothetical protein
MTTSLDLDTLDPAVPGDDSPEAQALTDHATDIADHIEDILGENEPLEGVDSTTGDIVPVEAAKPAEELTEPSKGTNESVPLATFLEEKGRVKEMREQVESMRKDFATVQAFKETYEQSQQAPTEPAPILDYDADPEVYVNNEMAYLQQQVADQQARLDAQDKQGNEAKAVADFRQSLAVEMQEAVKTIPDLSDAIQSIRAKNQHELVANGITDPATQAQRLDNWEINFAAIARNGGENVAEKLYTLAKNFGYTAKTATTGSNQKVQDLKNAANANTNLGTGGNTGGDAGPTFDEFEAAQNRIFSHLA